MIYKVMGRVNGRLFDGKKGDTIEEALRYYKELIAKESLDVVLSVAVADKNAAFKEWSFLEDEDLQLAEELTKEIFDGRALCRQYAPGSIRLRRK